MKHGSLLCLGILLASAASVSVGAKPAASQEAAKSGLGTVSGVVKDSSGTPQLGATVELVAESAAMADARHLLTNTQGFFRGDKLAPGFYTVRVTLAGYLPSLEKHVRISSNLTTVLRVELESMFASLEQTRRGAANASAEADDWKWVLRSSSGLRPVLQWNGDGDEEPASVVMETSAPRARGRIELMNGARRPGSVSNIGAAPGTAFAYDQKIDKFNHIVFAGQVSYDEDMPSGGLAAIWLPTGSSETGPQSTIVLREGKTGPNGPTFRGARLAQSGTMTLGDRVLVRAGGEFVMVGVGASAWTLRPSLEVRSRVGSDWYVDMVYTAQPTLSNDGDELAGELGRGARNLNALTSALRQLDAFPTVLWHDGRPVLESGRHEEVAAERKIGTKSLLQFAGFHDDYSHVAIFGRGSDAPADDYLQDFYSKGFAYDGGNSNSWGARLALKQRLNDDVELTAVYAFSGALVPSAMLEGALRDALRTEQLHSLGGKITTRVPRTNTQVSAGYKWVSGPALTRVDAYGESMYDMTPYLHIGIRQPLPRFALGRWEAIAECDNLLAQGYQSLTTGDGQIVVMPAARSFRGGVSVQF